MFKGLCLTLCLLTGCVLTTAQADAPAVKLRIDPDPAPATESFALVFEAQGAVDADPDFSPLEQDFEILGRNQQTSLQIVNGKRTRTTVWLLNVLPKHGAPLTVPAIRFGKLTTPPREITFASPTAGATGSDDGLFLEVDAEPASPYVQQQVIYSLRLWRRYEISNASLSEPELTADAIVKPIDADRRYEATRDGQRYEVIERRFAIFPQASGAVTIKPAVVTAQVVKRGFSLFDSFSQPVATKRIVSAAVELDVRPIPQDFPGGTWLPARQLSINEDWQPAGAAAKVGEPLTRTLNLWADGLTAGQLPPLEMADVPGLKLYPDRPQTSEQQQDTGYSAVMQRKTAIIPVDAGELSLPEITIPWWNTATNSLEIARVPARILTSEAAPGVTPDAPDAPAAVAAETPAAPPVVSTPVTTTATGDGFWRTLALVAAVGWLLTLALWWRRPGPAASTVPATTDDSPVLSALSQTVDASLARDDAHAVATALLGWAAARWSTHPPRTLGALAGRVDTDLAQALWSLDRALYQADAPRADLAALQRAWTAHRKRPIERTASTPSVLPPLYAGSREATR